MHIIMQFSSIICILLVFRAANTIIALKRVDSVRYDFVGRESVMMEYVRFFWGMPCQHGIRRGTKIRFYIFLLGIVVSGTRGSESDTLQLPLRQVCVAGE